MKEYYRYFYAALIMNEIYIRKAYADKQNYFFLSLFQIDRYGKFRPLSLCTIPTFAETLEIKEIHES